MSADPLMNPEFAMHRRFTLASLAAATLAGGAFVAPAASAPVTELPRMDCKTRIVDASGDAFLLANTAVALDGLDFTSIFLRLTADELQILVKFKDLKAPADMNAHDGAYKYEFSGKIGDTKVLTVQVAQTNPDEPWASTLKTPTSHSTSNAHTGSLKDEDKLPGWAHEFRYTEDLLIVTVPRARLEQNLGKALQPGDMMNAITMQTKHFAESNQTTVDQLASTATKTWDVGDDSCFGAPPSKLAELVAPSVAYTDTAALKAKLTTEAGQAIAGKPVEFKVGAAAPVIGTTGADGIATANYPAMLAAGDHPVVATFAGDTVDGKARIEGTITITTEATAFGALTYTKPTRTSRVVTATLLDNDKVPVAGQSIDWYVNGKKVASAVTDAKGKALLKTAKPTQTVYAKFAGVAGKYTGATAKSVKLA